MAYDIFISYRRKGSGFGVAGELQTKLNDKGYHVFLDVDEIVGGEFPTQIQDAIKQCHDFILILSPGALDRCKNSDDWVLKEISLAESLGKNILCLSLPDFEMPNPDQLPDAIKNIPLKQSFKWVHEYRNASLEKIENNLKTKIIKKKNRRKIWKYFGALMIVIFAGLVFLHLKDVVEHIEFNNQFYEYVHIGDSLMSMSKDPKEITDCRNLINSKNNYTEALNLKNENIYIIRDTINIESKIKEVERLRKEWIDKELKDANIFIEGEYYTWASSRINNAYILSSENDIAEIEKVEQKIPK